MIMHLKILLILIITWGSVNVHGYYLYDFNSLTLGDLNGQDSWTTTKYLTTTDISVTTSFGYDGSQAIRLDTSGGSGWVSASKPQDGMTLVMPSFNSPNLQAFQIDLLRSVGGNRFGVGYDTNSNGSISRDDYDEHGVVIKNSDDELVLSVGETAYTTTPMGAGWTRLRVVIDTAANSGQGQACVLYLPSLSSTTWTAVSGLQQQNLDLNTSAPDARNSSNWNHVFLHAEGDTGGFDNILFEDFSPPNDISLMGGTLTENSPINTTVGVLGASPSSDFIYTLVSGVGDTDNASFTISGSDLKNAVIPDYETKNSYSIRVRATRSDSGECATFEKNLTVNIIDVDESPIVSSPIANQVVTIGATPVTFSVFSHFSDPEQPSSSLAYTVTGNTNPAVVSVSSINPSDGNVTLTFNQVGSSTVTIEAQDSTSLTQSAIFTVTVNAPSVPTQAMYQSNPIAGSSFKFDTLVGTTASQSLTIQEIGDAALILRLATPPQAPFNFPNPLPFSFIPDGGSPQNISISCTPTALGSSSATLQLSTNDPDNSMVSYSLECMGRQPQLNSSVANNTVIDFGQVLLGNTVTRDIALSEVGNMEVVIESATVNGADAAAFKVITPSSFPLKIADGATATTMTVQCNPTAAEPLNATLQLTTNDPNHATLMYPLQCIGVSPNFTLTLNTVGSGSIVECGSQCSQTHPQGSTVNLSVTPAVGWQFEQWSGDCSSATVVMNADKTCTANFTAIPIVVTYTLNLNTNGEGSIAGCGTQCQLTYPQGDTVKLNITPAVGWQFSQWSGDCSSSDVVMNANKTCTANFTQIIVPVSPEEPPPASSSSPSVPGATLPTVPTEGGIATENMSNYHQTSTNLTVTSNSSVSGGTLAGTTTNQGLIANVTVAPHATVTGGKLSGFNTNYGTIQNITLSPYSEIIGGQYSGVITNEGTLINPTVLADGVIRGGKVGGVVLNQGILQDVATLPETFILGGTITGSLLGSALGYTIIGEANLEKVRLSRACLTMTVKIKQDVSLDATVTLPRHTNLNEAEMEDFCILPQSVAFFTKQRILGTEKLAFSTFFTENVIELPPDALDVLIPDQLANFQSDALFALSIEQYQHIPLDTWKGLHQNNMGGLNPTVIHEFDAEHLSALQLNEFQHMPNSGVAKWLTNLNPTQLNPELIEKLLPEDWRWEQETGILHAPQGTFLALKALKIIQLPEHVSLPEYQFDLNSTLTVGGIGTAETLLEKLNNTLSSFNYQAKQNQYGIVISTHSITQQQLAFLLDMEQLIQRDARQNSGVQFTEPGNFQVTTKDHLEINLYPAPKDPVAVATVLNNAQVVVGNKGDVLLLNLPSSTTRRIRAEELTQTVVIFDPFIESSPEDICAPNAAGEIECNWDVADAEMQPGFHFTETRAKQRAKLIYADGSAQTVYPTVFSPETFMTEARKFPGVEAIVFNTDGTFTVTYQGQKLQLFPSFAVTVTPLEKYQHVKPSVKLQGDQLEYQVQYQQQLLTTTLFLSE